jgi:hypothetical protein
VLSDPQINLDEDEERDKLGCNVKHEACVVDEQIHWALVAGAHEYQPVSTSDSPSSLYDHMSGFRMATTPCRNDAKQIFFSSQESMKTNQD